MDRNRSWLTRRPPCLVRPRLLRTVPKQRVANPDLESMEVIMNAREASLRARQQQQPGTPGPGPGA